MFILSGYEDSNLGPPAPKAGTLTGLCYTPNGCLFQTGCKFIQNIHTNKIFGLNRFESSIFYEGISQKQ